MRIITISIILVLMLSGVILTPITIAAPVISNINLASICNTSVAINFRTDIPSSAFLEYGTTASYGSTTIHDTVRLYREHGIQLTGLSANTLYHFRVNTISGGTTQSSDQTFTTTSSGSACITLPSQVDSRMPNMVGAVEKTIKNSGGDYTPAQFQTALNDAGTANERRIITVDAGITITGQVSMPANSDGNWILIRPSTHASLAEGKRISPNDISNMFKIRNLDTDPAIVFAAASNHVRIIGAEITIDPSAIANAPAGPEQGGLVSFLQNVRGSSANLPKFIGIDRCYIHGLSNKNTRRGIFLLGEDLFVIDSYLDDFHTTGSDAQGILLADIKRNKILNNTIISAGENVMWGGTGLNIVGYVVSELEFLRNHLYYPINWKNNGPSFSGINWVEKNLFEIKTGAKLFVFGNFFGGINDAQGGYWVDAQSLAINIKLEQNSTGPATCELMEDLFFYKNFGKNLHAGPQVVGRTAPAQGCTNNPDRVLWKDNVFELDAATWNLETGAQAANFGASAWIISGTHNVQIIHNTTINTNPTSTTCGSVFGDGSLLFVGDAPPVKWNGFTFKDNISDFRGCGVSGGGFLNNANGSLNAVFNSPIFTNNGIMRPAGVQSNFPTGNVFATSWGSQLVSFNSGLDGNYRVTQGSSWDNAASDGRDIGADVDGTILATEFAPTGNWTSASLIMICNWHTNITCNLN